MQVHAIRTGEVRIKSAQVEGRGHGLARRLGIFFDRTWTDWLPTYAWAIEHQEGVVVVDTGQGLHLLEHRRSLHPYIRWEVEFRIEPEQEIGPRLHALGVGPRDVRQVVLTHLHMDHDGGLRHFAGNEILVDRNELRAARGWAGAMRGYQSNRWPSWFDPVALDLDPEPFGPFATSKRLTRAGDIVAVGTPGHTANHLSVIAFDGDTAMFFAGDASYTQNLMVAGRVDGVSPDAAMARATLAAIGQFARRRPTVYLPTHDPDSGRRLATRQVVINPASSRDD